MFMRQSEAKPQPIKSVSIPPTNWTNTKLTKNSEHNSTRDTVICGGV